MNSDVLNLNYVILGDILIDVPPNQNIDGDVTSPLVGGEGAYNAAPSGPIVGWEVPEGKSHLHCFPSTLLT